MMSGPGRARRPAHSSRRMPTGTRMVGFAAASLAFLFALGHFAYAAGIPVLGGSRHELDRIASDAVSNAVTETGVGLLAVAGGVVALTLVQRWGSTLPWRLLRLLAWVGGAVAVAATVYGLTGLVLEVLAVLGGYTFPKGHDTTATGWWLYWYALFAAIGAAFAATVWLTRRPGALRRRPGSA